MTTTNFNTSYEITINDNIYKWVTIMKNIHFSKKKFGTTEWGVSLFIIISN